LKANDKINLDVDARRSFEELIIFIELRIFGTYHFGVEVVLRPFVETKTILQFIVLLSVVQRVF
jgi:hypothetical protein